MVVAYAGSTFHANPLHHYTRTKKENNELELSGAVINYGKTISVKNRRNNKDINKENKSNYLKKLIILYNDSWMRAIGV
jgi:hypothetical protein